MTPPRVWLRKLTDASSSFGRETAIQALEHGDNFVATLRKPDALSDLILRYEGARLLFLPLDHAFHAARGALGCVDIVFNKAGYVVLGESEAVPEDTARAMFEVNFWGAVRVSLKAVCFFREEKWPKGGLLIQNSATIGLLGSMPRQSTMRCQVVIVEPGAFKTSVVEKNMVVIPPHPTYANLALAVHNVCGAFLRGAGKQVDTSADLHLHRANTTRAVAKVIELAELQSPPLYIPLGLDAIGAIPGKIKQLTEDIDACALGLEGLAR
ncbi:NAD-P-binding protein [Trametes punicea]|nr:NAD-P-binding protein [Trametes punicea]